MTDDMAQYLSTRRAGQETSGRDASTIGDRDATIEQRT